MKHVLITGSNGLVGSEAVNFFSKKNYRAIGIDNNLRNYFFGVQGDTRWKLADLKKKNRKYINYSIDIRNYKKIENIFKKYSNKIKCVIHAAAQPSHDWAYKEPVTDFSVNALATLYMLELTKKFSPKAVFIYLSTNKVYGDLPNYLKFSKKKKRFELKKKDKYFNGIDECMSIDNSMHSLFGVSKCSADLLVQEYGKNLKLKTGIFRAGCITGPNHSGAELHGFLNYLIKCNLNKKLYKIFGYKGKQVRDNIHSFDLINCFWSFIKKPRYGEVYNIGGSRLNSCSVLELISKIEKFTKIKMNFKIQKKNRKGDHKWYISDVAKFKSHYPKWKLKYNLDEIIIQTIEHLRDKMNPR